MKIPYSALRLLALAFLSIAVLATARPARAQNSELTRGIRLPFPAVSLGDDASGVDVNPGGLGFVRSLEAQFFATELAGGVGGSGQAFYLAAPTVFGTFALGITHLGTQTAFGQQRSVENRFDDYARLSLSYAHAFSPRFSIGLSLHHNFGDASRVQLTTLDVGAVWRPSRWLSFGAAVQDLTTPSSNGGFVTQLPAAGVPGPGFQSTVIITQPQTTGGLGALGGLSGLGGLAVLGRDISVHRAWLVGMGLRPGTERVLIAADLRIEEIARRVDPTFRLLVEPLPGLAIGGSLEWRDRSGRSEVTGQLGLTWNFDLASSALRGQVAYSSYVEKGRGHDGFTVGARLYRARERALTEPRERFVKIHLKHGIPESPAPASLLGGSGAPKWTMSEALAALDAAGIDGRARGVLLAFDGVGIGLAQAEELRAAIERLRARGKRVFAFIEGASNAVYYAASAAERVYLHPLSSLNTVGFAAQIVYLRGLADKVGILPEFIAIGKYKSAPEQLMRKGASEPAKEARLAFLSDAMERFVAGIAKSRGKAPAQVTEMIARAPITAREAVAAGFADGTDYLDALEKRLEKDEKIELRLLADPGAIAGGRWGGYDGIAVVHVEGTITDGKSSVDPLMRGRNAGAETIIEALKAAKQNRRVRAVVLRVNSPGGSGTASERIWREIEQLKKVKPIVASFGNLAASGGYYVSAGANEIFADPSTLTGSIGIFFGKMSLQELFKKGDVHTETTKTAPRADIITAARPWTDDERAHVTRLVKEFYDEFVERVVKGRKLSKEHVERVAQGRVWSGRAALAHRLIDKLGGLDEAIERAKELGGHRRGERMAVVHYPQPPLLHRLLQRLGLSSEQSDTAKSLTNLARWIGPALLPVSPQLLHLKSGEPWALLPFELELR